MPPREAFREAIPLSLGDYVQSWWLVLFQGGVHGREEEEVCDAGWASGLRCFGTRRSQ